MDLASLQVFQTVARERSFSRAAEKLYRTQPAVSISIRKLEEWVGQPLFIRGSGARNLTDAGVLLLEYAERMLNLREEIRKGIKELHGLERGQVEIGANESSIHALLPALDRYRRVHPGIHIRVHRVFSRDIPRELLNYHLDLGVISYIPEERELGTDGIPSRFTGARGLARTPAGEAPRSGHHRAWGGKIRRRTSWNRPTASAWFRCLPSIMFRCAWISSCRPSKASSGSSR